MCLLVVAVRPRADLRLVLLANRDEWLARATAPLGPWQDGSGIHAGRDLEGGGTWLGIGEGLRVAALTNVRSPAEMRPRAPGERSRGQLPESFLRGREPAGVFAARACAEPGLRGFNLVLGDATDLLWCSNRAPGPVVLEPGIHGVSNAALDTPWPKVERARSALAEALSRPGDPDPEALLAILADRTQPPDAALPDTGVGLELERALAPIRVVLPGYATRSSTVIVVRADGRTTMIERTLAPEGPADTRLELPPPSGGR